MGNTDLMILFLSLIMRFKSAGLGNCLHIEGDERINKSITAHVPDLGKWVTSGAFH